MCTVSRTLVSASATLLAAHTAPASALFPLGRRFFPAITRVRADDAVALTFDDGPDRGLDSFLGLLEEAKAQATFFVVGEHVEHAPDRLKEIVSCGHEIAVHCHRHRNHLRLTPLRSKRTFVVPRASSRRRQSV